MPEIEFVQPDPDPGEDEELVAGRPRREWLPRGQRFVRVGAAAVLAVVAGAVLVAVLQHDGGKQAAGGSPTSSAADVPSFAAPSGTVPADHLYSDAPDVPVTVDDGVCPNENACTTDVLVPEPVSAALAHAFPSVADVQGSSVTVDGSHPTLRGRTVTATVGTLKLSVLIHLATRFDNATSAAADNGGTRIVYARTVAQGLAVTVSVSGSPTQVPSLATVQALAADRRLVVVG